TGAAISPTARNLAATISLSNGFMMYSLAPACSAREMWSMPFSVVHSGGHRRLWRHLQHAIDIEDDHELAVESVDAACELCHAGIEVDGIFLAAGFGEPENLPDGVDQEAIGFATQVDADGHRRLAVIVFGQAQPREHVDRGDGAA